MTKLLYLLAFLGGIASLLFVFMILSGSFQGAPQEAAAAGVACAISIAPYVLARSWQEMRS